MRVASLLAAVVFIIAMLGTTLPTPLYPLYERAFGIAPALITIIFAAYALSVVLALLLFGRLSDDLGRRGVLLAGLALSLASAVVFLCADSVASLFVGRVLSGLSAGLFTGTATATLVDLAPPNRRQGAAVLAVAANCTGLGCGTLLAGTLAAYAPAPLRLPYAVDAALVVVALLAMFGVPETVTARQPRFRLTFQRLRVPQEIRGLFLRAVVAGMCAFAVSGLFSAVVPSFLATVLHRPNPALSGVIVFVLFALTAAGQIVVRALGERIALWVACATLLVGLGVLAAAIALHSLVLSFAAAAVEGLGQGLAMGFGLAQINDKIDAHRGEVSSTYFVLLYLALALPVVGVGVLAEAWTSTAASLTFCAVTGVTIVAVIVSLAGQRSDVRRTP